MKLNKFLLPVLLLGIASCSENEVEFSDKWKVDGEVPASFVGCMNKVVASRSTVEGIWEPGNAIGISGGDYTNCKYVAETEGEDRHFTPASAEDSIYFKASEPVRFTAYYPYTGETGTEAGVITKKISGEDQTKENITNIDFLYGGGQGSMRSPLVALELDHKMSLVVFDFKNGYGVDLDQMQSFTISGLKLEGAFDTKTGNIVATSTEAEDITIAADEYSGTTYYTKSVILFPQTGSNLTMSAKFDGYDVKGSFPIMNLVSGTKYTCKVTVNKGGLDIKLEGSVEWTDDAQTSTPAVVESKVTIPALPSGDGISDVKLTVGDTEYTSDNWPSDINVATGQDVVLSFELADGKRVTAFDGSPKSGSCKMQFSYDNASGLSKCTYSDFGPIVELNDFGLTVGTESRTGNAPKVGDYYYSDGTWGAETTDKNIIGVVFNVGVGAGPGNFWGMNKYSGYVVALTNTDKRTKDTDYHNDKDQSGRDIWGENYDMSIISSEDTECLGYVTCSKVKEQSNFATNYKAINTAITFDVVTPEGTSGWYLPSIGEFRLLSKSHSTFSGKLDAIGDKSCNMTHWWHTYWTSSKSSDDKPVYIDFRVKGDDFEQSIVTKFNGKNPLVRPILTF